MVTVDDIALELGRPTPAEGSVEAQQWEKWISNAQLLIRTRLGDLADLDPQVLDYVVTQAVAAHIRKPDNSTQVDVTIDDGHVNKRYETSAGRVAILPEWWAMLAPGRGSKAFEINMAPDAPSPTLEDVLALRPDLRLQYQWPVDEDA